MIPAVAAVESPATVELALSLELQPGSETALLRTLTLLHRRRCQVLEARYDASEAGGDRLTVRVAAPPRHAHCVASWLSALIEVRAVVGSRCETSRP